MARMTSRIRVSAILAAAAAAALAVSACSAKKSHSSQPHSGPPDAANSSGAISGSSGPGRSAALVEPATLTVSTTGAPNAVSPAAPVTVRATGGRLASVTLSNGQGIAVKGALSADQSTWSSVEPLGYSKTYQLNARATNAAGTLSAKTATFTTVTPNNLTMPYIQTAAGGAIGANATFGVGQVVRVHFDEPISDRKAAQAAITVTTRPTQLGGFSWLDDQNVYWRTKSYLTSGTKVTVAAKVYGKDLGGSLYGQADTTASFTVGPKHVSIADDATKIIKVYENDKLVKTIPTSMGRDATIAGDTGPIDLRTNSGPHVVVGGETNINMNSASFGLSKGANAYKTIVPVGVRISYDGEYVHWADWSVWAQGNTDTSHGCLNVSPEAAWWFYHWSQPGDIVDVRNTGRTLQEWNSGYWTVSWANWLADGAA